MRKINKTNINKLGLSKQTLLKIICILRIKRKYYEHLHSSKVDNVDEMGKLIEKLKLLQIPQKQTNKQI